MRSGLAERPKARTSAAKGARLKAATERDSVASPSNGLISATDDRMLIPDLAILIAGLTHGTARASRAPQMPA
jgi:hypothetical protein